MVAAALAVAATAVPGCVLGRNTRNCDRTVIDVSPVNASTLRGLVIHARLRTKGGAPVPGRTLELSFEERRGSGGVPVESSTGENGEALFGIEEAARDHAYVRQAIVGATLLHVKYRNPGELSSDDEKRGFCGSDAYASFTYTGGAL